MPKRTEAPKSIRKFLAEIGSKGGKARAKLPKERLSEIGKMGGRPKKKPTEETNGDPV